MSYLAARQASNLPPLIIPRQPSTFMGLKGTPKPAAAVASSSSKPSPVNGSPLPTPSPQTPLSSASSSSSSSTTFSSSASNSSPMTHIRRWTSSLNSPSKAKEGTRSGKRKAGSKTGGKSLTIAMIGPPQPLTTPVPFACSPLPYDNSSNDNDNDNNDSNNSHYYYANKSNSDSTLMSPHTSDPIPDPPLRPTPMYVTIHSPHSPSIATRPSLFPQQPSETILESTQGTAAERKERSKWRTRLFPEQKRRELRRSNSTSTSTGQNEEEEDHCIQYPCPLASSQQTASITGPNNSGTDLESVSLPTAASSNLATAHGASLTTGSTQSTQSHPNEVVATTTASAATYNSDNSGCRNFTEAARGLQSRTDSLASLDALNSFSVPSSRTKSSLDDPSLVASVHSSPPVSNADIGRQPTSETVFSQSTDSFVRNESIEPADVAASSPSLSPISIPPLDSAKAVTAAHLLNHAISVERPSFGYRPRLCSMSSDSEASSSDSEDSATDDSGSEDSVSHRRPSSKLTTGQIGGGISPTDASTNVETAISTGSTLPPPSSAGGRSQSLSSTLLKSGGIRIPTSLMTLFNNKEKESPTLATPVNATNEANGHSGSTPSPTRSSMHQSDPRTTNIKRLAYIHALRKLREREKRPFRHAVLLHLLLLHLRRGISERQYEEIGRYYGNMTPVQLAQKLEQGNPSGLAQTPQYQQQQQQHQQQAYLARLRMPGEGYASRSSYQRQPSDRYTGPFGARVNAQPHIQPLAIPSRTSSMSTDDSTSGVQINVARVAVDTEPETSPSHRLTSPPTQSQVSVFRDGMPHPRVPSSSVPDYQTSRGSVAGSSTPWQETQRRSPPPPPLIQPTAILPRSQFLGMSSFQGNPSFIPPPSPTSPTTLAYPTSSMPPFTMEPQSVDPAQEPVPSKINILPKRTTGRKGLLLQQQQQQQQYYHSMVSSLGAGGEFVPADTGLSSGVRPSFASTTVVTVRTEDDEMVTCPLLAGEDNSNTPSVHEATVQSHQSRGGSSMMGDYGGGYSGASMQPLLPMPTERPLSPPLVEGLSVSYHSQHLPISYVQAPTFSSAMAPLSNYATYSPPPFAPHPPPVGADYMSNPGPIGRMMSPQLGAHQHPLPHPPLQPSPSPSPIVALPQHRYPQFQHRRPSAPDVHSSQHQYPLLHQRRPSASELASPPPPPPFYPPPGAFTITPIQPHQRPSFLPLPVRTPVEEQRLFTAPNLPMHVHSYQFPAPTSPTAPSSNGMMAMSVSTPGLTTMAPAPHPTVFAAPVPIAPPMIQNTYQHQHQHMHHPPAPISVKSSPSPDASQSPELLSPPSSASSDVTSISEDTGDDGEQRRQVQGTPRLEVFPASMKDEGTTYQEDQAQDYRPPSLVESEVTQPAAHPAPIELDVQPNDEFEMDLESPWLHNSEPLSRPNVGLSIHSNLLLLPSLTSTSALPLPSPPLSPHPDLEFPQPAVTAGTTTAPVMPVAEQVIVPPSPTFSPSPSIPEPSPRSASPSESRNENIAVSSSEPPEPVLPKKRIERGYSSEPRAQLLFEPLSSAGHVVDLFTADDDEDESAGNVVERPHQVHSPLVEDLIRSIALSGHEPMYGGTRSSSSYWSGLTRRSSSPAPEKLTSATKAAATTATTVTTIGVARSKSSRTFIPGHTKRPSMNAPSIIISPSMNGSGFADNKTNKGMAARVNAAAASMLPSPAPDSPLPGQESMTYEQRLKLLSESQPLNAAGARAPSPVVEKEDEDMPLAWVQMRLRN